MVAEASQLRGGCSGSVIEGVDGEDSVGSGEPLDLLGQARVLSDTDGRILRGVLLDWYCMTSRGRMRCRYS